MNLLYSSNARKYAKYRWDYAPKAISAIFNSVGISSQTVIADLGAGTGILTKHFIGKAKLVYAIEPEAEMRSFLEKAFSGNPFCQIINGSAENTTLPAHSADLITVGQAIHWFEPVSARDEFLRILKPSGWLAVLRNYGTDPVYEKAVGRLFEQFSKSEPARRISRQPMSFYFGHEAYQKLLFPFEYSLDWESFLGALMSSAFMPDEHSLNFGKFEASAREVFDSLSLDGRLTSTGETELFLGHFIP
jgi:ubiquinone/menaquinone biosynthesis C-methylase UbiE